MSKTTNKKAQKVLDALVEAGFIAPGDADRFLATVQEAPRPKQ